MIKQIGTKIYYCLLSGNVIKIIGDIQGYVKISLVKIRFLIEQSKNIYLIGKISDLNWL